MKPLVVILVAALSVAVGADAHATSHRRHRLRAAAHETHAKAHAIRHRARVRVRRTSAPSLRSTSDDEIVLSPTLMRQLQHNLAEAGYYDGTIDGRLTARTRAALADFQRDYHMGPNGHLDRATAAALLGRDAVVGAAPPTSSLRKRKGPQSCDWGPERLRRRPTLPHGVPCSTIGPGGLNFRVRDGIGCGPSGMAAGNLLTRLELPNLRKRTFEASVELVRPTLAFDPAGHLPARVFRHFRRKNNGGQAARPISTG